MILACSEIKLHPKGCSLISDIKNLADENVIINYIKFDKCGDETNYKESNIEIKPDNFYEFPVNCPNVKLGDFEDDLFLEYEMGNLVVDTSGYLKNHFK